MSISTVSARAALTLLVLGLAACSFSFKAGGGASTEAGKPAKGGDDSSGKPTSKPISKTDPASPSDEPAASDEPTPSEEPDPTRAQPDEPPPVVEPQLTAVCRVDDESLAALCHRVFDPIAADDSEAWSRQLGEAVVVTRPTYRDDMHRHTGSEAVLEAARDAGGLRALLHMRATDRVVVTVSNDCRQCRHSLVAYEVNTRSGTVVVDVDMSQPPRVAAVNVSAYARRPHLGEARRPAKKEPTIEKPAATVEAPKTEIVTPPAEEAPAAKPAKKVKKQPVLAPKSEAKIEAKTAKGE